MWRAFTTWVRLFLFSPWGDPDALRARLELSLASYARDVSYAGDVMSSAAENHADTERLLRVEALTAIEEAEADIYELQLRVSRLKTFVQQLDEMREADDGLAR